jgi:hypothetical protein
MLKNLKVRNYKRFGDLQFSDFRRVNLLTGKNNCGKTSVLEAIMLLLDWERSSKEFVKVFRPGIGQNLGNERENFWKWLFPRGDVQLTFSPKINYRAINCVPVLRTARRPSPTKAVH